MKDLSLQELIETFLYTSDNMFGEIVHEAEQELHRRFPPPDWAKDHWEQDEHGNWRHK